MADFEELQRTANNATSDSQFDEDGPCADDIARWKHLFSYTYDEVKEKIVNHRLNKARERVSKDQWTLLRSHFEGYNREAYEYSLTLRSPPSDQESLQKPASGTHASFVFKMEGPLQQANVVRDALESDSAPEFKQGTCEDGEASFCWVDGAGKAAIDRWLLQRRIMYRPTFVREALARKNLSAISIYPFLGVDATLPQHRLATSECTPKPQQEQYPVWYFFYGTLAISSKLAEVLQLPEQEVPELHPASVGHGVIKTWAGKFKAPIDGQSKSTVQGSAYEVQTAEQEENLRIYETARYEVVRCSIIIRFTDREDVVPGLTFRFIDKSQLS